MGIGILVPMDSPVGMIFGLISILIIIFFVILIIAALFSSALSGAIGFIGSINDEKDLWYHKKDKSNGIAFLCSLLLPFSGSLYLKENEFNLVTTIISIFVILVTMWGLLSIPDFYLHNDYVITILALLWIVSLIALGINIRQYNKYKNSYPADKKTKFESICGNKLFIAIPIIIFILFLSVNFMAMNDTSDKLYENNHYSLVYPNNYVIGSRDNTQGSTGITFTDFDSKDSGGKITISYSDDNGYSLDEHKRSTIDYYEPHGLHIKDKGTTTVGGVKGYVLESKGEWTSYNVIKDDIIYTITFNKDSYDCMDEVINSFKFK